jgi:hypothetical protein
MRAREKRSHREDAPLLKKTAALRTIDPIEHVAVTRMT